MSEIIQGSDEWLALRAGKVTASRVADIVRKVKGDKPSASRQRYLGELVAERLTGVPASTFKSAEMQWGNDNEAHACDGYTFYHGGTLTAVAFVDHPRIAQSGASPDRLVNADGLIEIKCPATHTHIDNLLGAPIDPDYVKQIQWQLACTGRAWCDYCSFDPRMPEDLRLFVTRVERDDTLIRELETAVEQFLAEVDDTIHRLRRQYAEAA